MGLDYYGILGINHDATISDIRKAYRHLALKYHPDRSTDIKAKALFFNIAEAYDVLSCSETKSLYDQYGEEGIKSGVFQPPNLMESEGPLIAYMFHGDPYKVFRDFFGVDNPFAELKLPNVDPEYKYVPIPEEEKIVGEDMIIPFPLSLEEAFRGCSKSIVVEQTALDEETKKTVHKSKFYKFKVPLGCVDGKKFIFKGYGNEGRNVIPGDVIFVAKLQEHEIFKLEGKDFVISKKIPLVYALSGCVIDVETIQGRTLHLPLTSVVKPGERMTLNNEGMTIENSSDRGNMLIEFEIDFPDRLSENQKNAIKSAFYKKKQTDS